MSELSVQMGKTDGLHTSIERRTNFSNELTPSVAVAEAVAEAKELDPTEGRPLHDYLLTDALNALLTDAEGDATDITVTFDIDGTEVTITSDGEITVR